MCFSSYLWGPLCNKITGTGFGRRKFQKEPQSRGRSLSDLVESYLKMISENQSAHTGKLSPRVDSLRGTFMLPEDFDYKKEMGNAITRKHLSHDKSVH